MSEHPGTDAVDEGLAVGDLVWRAEAAEQSRDQAIAEVERPRYLSVDCPVCGRKRLEYTPATHLIRCEKCGAEGDAIYDADPVAEVERLREALEKIAEVEAPGGLLWRLSQIAREALNPSDKGDTVPPT